MTARIIQFLKQTSIKGVHRIFLTKSYFLRTLWGISVICFLSMAAYQAFLLTKGYLEYNSIISMKETFSDFTGQTGRFPDVTFCNLNPFSVSTHNLSNIPSLGTYHDTILNKTSCSSCSTQEEDDLEELRKELLTTGGYYTTIGASKAEQISHTQEAFIVSCKVGLLSGMHPRKIPCQGIATIVPFHDCVYFNCYTIKLPPATPEDLYGAIIVVLHLNNHLEIIEQQKFLTPHFLPSQMSGALMTLHEPDNIPVIIRDAINLPSGYFTSAKLSLVQRNSLPSPYGECKHKHDLGEKGVHYQQIICYSSCVRKLVLRSCGCVDLGLYRDPSDPDEYNSTIETNACLSSKLTSQKLRQNWACMKQIGLNATIPCLSSCPTPCEEVSYIKDVRYVQNDRSARWRHAMKTFSALLPLCAWNSTVNSPHKGQRRPLMCSLICVWANDWVNNRDAGDLGRHCAPYDVTVMAIP